MYQSKTKVHLLFLALFLCVPLFFSTFALATPIISLEPAISNPVVGNSFNISVNIDSAVDLFAYQFDLSFNPAIMAAISVNESGFFASDGGSTFFIPGAIDNIAGTITFTADSLIGALAGVSGSGVLSSITFTALAEGTSALSLSNVALLDSNLNDLAFSSVGSSVNVPEPAIEWLLSIGLLALLVGIRRDQNWRLWF